MHVKEVKFGYKDCGVLKHHCFALGLGPCGRWVSQLRVEITLAVVTITQDSFAEDLDTQLRRCHLKHHELSQERAMALGDYGYPCSGWDNVVTMTPTYDAWRKHQDDNAAEMNRLYSLVVETKVFVYRLEDIRGRITALQ